MPLVASPRTFAGGLPGSHPLPPIVQQLGHEVSSLATPGLVVARTRPVEAFVAGSIPAPVQRRAARGSRTSPVAASEPVFAPEPEMIEQVAHVAAPAAAPAAPPIRTMPTVSRQSVHTPDRPLTSAAVAARPAAVQRAAAAVAAAAEGSPRPVAPQPSSGGMRRVPSAPAAMPVVSRQASSSPAAPVLSALAANPVPSRSGLGAPMASLPASARPIAAPGPVVSRSTTSGPMPIAASSLRAPVQRSASSVEAPQLALGSGSAAGAATTAGSGPTAAPRLPDLPFLPVVRAGSPGTSATAPTPAAPSVQTSAASAGPEIRPLAGANPIRTSIAIQRDVEDDADDEPDDQSALPSPWWGGNDAAAPATDTGTQLAAADGRATSIQRLPIDSGNPTGSPFLGAPSRAATQALAPTTPGRAPVQRIAGPSGRQSLPALTLPHAAGPASAAAAASDAGRQTIVFPGASSHGSPSVQTNLLRPSAPVAAAFAGQGSGASVQREGGNVSIQAPEPPPPAGAAGSAGSGGPAGLASSAGSGHSEKDLDELAQALFGRIRGRLRSDLIYDREAKGLTFDNV